MLSTFKVKVLIDYKLVINTKFKIYIVLVVFGPSGTLPIKFSLNLFICLLLF